MRRARPSGVSDDQGDALDGMPPGLRAYLERVALEEGAVLIRQDEPPGDVFVLESGRLRVEMVTQEGTRMRLRTVRPGVVVGEIAMYSGVSRTADVVAETPSVVLRLSRASIERMEADRSGARRGAAPMAGHDVVGATDRYAEGRHGPLRLELGRSNGPSSDDPRGCSPRSRRA